MLKTRIFQQTHGFKRSEFECMHQNGIDSSRWKNHFKFAYKLYVMPLPSKDKIEYKLGALFGSDFDMFPTDFLMYSELLIHI